MDNHNYNSRHDANNVTNNAALHWGGGSFLFEKKNKKSTLVAEVQKS